MDGIIKSREIGWAKHVVCMGKSKGKLVLVFNQVPHHENEFCS